LRFLFLQAGYRSKQNFTFEEFEKAKETYQRILQRILKIYSDKCKNGNILDEYKHKFDAAIADDFNTSVALSIALDMLNSDEKPEDIYTTLCLFDNILGLLISDTVESISLFLSNKNVLVGDNVSVSENVKIIIQNIKEEIIPQNILDLSAKRSEFKANKQYAEADEVRKEIEAFGYDLKDTSTGPVLKRK
jgi:cysteinyl-tRNA synthetase